MTSGSPRAARWRVVRSILVVATISWIAWVVATCEGDAPPPSDVDTASEASPSSRPGPILKGSPPAGDLLEPSATPDDIEVKAEVLVCGLNGIAQALITLSGYPWADATALVQALTSGLLDR